MKEPNKERSLSIVMLTSYYHPHISGLTLYFQRLAEQYVKLGHEVTMITARHDPALPKYETIQGVKVIRSKYLFKINKGLFLPFIVFDSWDALKKADVIHYNLPSIEALPVAFFAKLLGVPSLTTYVCDITLPKFFGSTLLDKFIDFINYSTIKLSDLVASFTIDFAKHSRVLKNYNEEIIGVYPIVEIEADNKPIEKLENYKRNPKIGMATRIAADKGIHILMEALEAILKKYPDLQVVFAGNPKAVGEEKYANYLEKFFKKYKNNIIFLGQLEPQQMPVFFKELDVLIVASTNSTEAFGMVQIEAMFEGTPVVATNLPGVRIPIKVTQMGEIAKIGDVKDLANQILKVLSEKEKYIKPHKEIKKTFNTKKATQDYLDIYYRLIDEATHK